MKEKDQILDELHDAVKKNDISEMHATMAALLASLALACTSLKGGDRQGAKEMLTNSIASFPNAVEIAEKIKAFLESK